MIPATPSERENSACPSAAFITSGVSFDQSGVNRNAAASLTSPTNAP